MAVMKWKLISGIVRHLLTLLAGWLVAQGWIDEASTQEVVGYALGAIGVLWSGADKVIISPPNQSLG